MEGSHQMKVSEEVPLQNLLHAPPPLWPPSRGDQSAGDGAESGGNQSSGGLQHSLMSSCMLFFRISFNLTILFLALYSLLHLLCISF
ncbi:unnamed protein product [Arctogadus glacialis]